MTFAIVAYSENEKQLGLAIASCGLFTGTICPIIGKNGSYIGTLQAWVSKELRSKLVKLLESETISDSLSKTLLGSDDFSKYRQIAVIDNKGNRFAHTGKETLPISNHFVEENFIVSGNMLDSKSCLIAMKDQFYSNETLPLAERLLRCLEKAKETGGQKAQGQSLRERSSALYILDQRKENNFSLRVDMNSDAIAALRKQWDTYKSYDNLLESCGGDPANLPSLTKQDEALPAAPSIFL